MPSKACRWRRSSVFTTLLVTLPPTPTKTGARPPTTARVCSTMASISSSSKGGALARGAEREEAAHGRLQIVLQQSFVAREVDLPVDEGRDQRQPDARYRTVPGAHAFAPRWFPEKQKARDVMVAGLMVRKRS